MAFDEGCVGKKIYQGKEMKLKEAEAKAEAKEEAQKFLLLSFRLRSTTEDSSGLMIFNQYIVVSTSLNNEEKY